MISPISNSRFSSEGTNIPLWELIQKKESPGRKRFTVKEIITQLELSLLHPEKFELEVIPGLISLHTLEVFLVRKYQVKLLSQRSPSYLVRWMLSKLLTFGNLGNEERILTAFAFSKDNALEELFHLIDLKIKKRKVQPLQRTYEFARQIKPDLFPKLPDVRDANSSPNFTVTIEELRPQRIPRYNRPRNPSAVGGKHRQELSFLPIISQSGAEAHNVVVIFLELMKLMRQSESILTDQVSSGKLVFLTEES